MNRLILLLILTILNSQKALAENNSEDLFHMSLTELLAVKVESTSFFQEPLSATSYSVTRSEQKDWRNLGVRNVGDLMNYMPSTIATFSTGQSRIMAIRGYMDVNPNTGTALRFDGVPMNKIREGGGLMSIDGFDLNLLDSVELIRGPGSSLHGNDAFHGVLSLEPIDLDGTQARLTVEKGSFDDVSSSWMTAVRKEHHHLSLGLAYRDIGNEEQAYDYVDHDLNQAATAMRKNTRESANALATYRYKQDELELSTTLFLLSFDGDELPGAGELGFGNQKDRDFSEYQDRIQLAKVDGKYRIDADRSLEIMGFHWQYQDQFEIDLRDTSLASILKSQRKEGHDGFQFHLLQRFSDEGVFTIGYEYLNIELKSFTDSTLFTEPNWVELVGNSPGLGYRRELHSLLVDGRQPLKSLGVVLSYGMRMDEYNDFQRQITPRAGLSKFFAHRQSVHLTYGEGFRAPSIYELFGSTALAPNEELEPETIKSLELKYNVQGEHVFHAVTAFKNVWEDAIETIFFLAPVDGKYARFENTGLLSSYGIEYEAKSVWDPLEANFYLSSIWDKHNNLTDGEIEFPQWLGGVNLGYRLSDRWDIRINNRFFRRKSYTNRDGGKSNQLNYFRTDMVFVWENHSGLEFDFVVRNVFDRENSLPARLSALNGYKDQGLNISTRFRYSF